MTPRVTCLARQVLPHSVIGRDFVLYEQQVAVGGADSADALREAVVRLLQIAESAGQIRQNMRSLNGVRHATSPAMQHASASQKGFWQSLAYS